MEKKKSSIDKFVLQLKRKGLLITEDSEYIVAYLEAKAMHKEESELLFECGRNFQLTGEGTFNQVYNETFGGEIFQSNGTNHLSHINNLTDKLTNGGKNYWSTNKSKGGKQC